MAVAAAPLQAAPLLPGKGKAIFSSDAEVQGFAPAQGLPLVSFHPSSSVYATYTSAAAVALQSPFLEPLHAAIEGIAATDSVAGCNSRNWQWLHHLPGLLDFSQHLSKTQHSLSSMSQSPTPKKRPPPCGPPKINDCAAKRARHDDEDDDDNDPHVFTPSKFNADDNYKDITFGKEDSGVCVCVSDLQ